MSDHSLVRSSLTPAETQAIRVVLDTLPSEHSRRAYERALTDFFHWHRAARRPKLSKAVVQRYAAELREAGMAASSINQRLSAIRKLATEAADNGALDPVVANGIRAVKGARQEGRRTGNWLTREQAQVWLGAPDTKTMKGLRDRALLAVLIGCGLRRAEAAVLKFDHVQQRDGRWVLVDLVGKRDKIRSVPMPNWAKAAIDAWSRAAGVSDGPVFRAVNKGGKVVGNGITAQAIYNIIVGYAEVLKNKGVAPHDLRRTFAKLAHKGGAAIDQIQLSLGHESIQTTEEYLGVEQDPRWYCSRPSSSFSSASARHRKSLDTAKGKCWRRLAGERSRRSIASGVDDRRGGVIPCRAAGRDAEGQQQARQRSRLHRRSRPPRPVPSN